MTTIAAAIDFHLPNGVDPRDAMREWAEGAIEVSQRRCSLEWFTVRARRHAIDPTGGLWLWADELRVGSRVYLGEWCNEDSCWQNHCLEAIVRQITRSPDGSFADIDFEVEMS